MKLIADLLSWLILGAGMFSRGAEKSAEKAPESLQR